MTGHGEYTLHFLNAFLLKCLHCQSNFYLKIAYELKRHISECSEKAMSLTSDGLSLLKHQVYNQSASINLTYD